jgi:hypothetical protein
MAKKKTTSSKVKAVSTKRNARGKTSMISGARSRSANAGLSTGNGGKGG